MSDLYPFSGCSRRWSAVQSDQIGMDELIDPLNHKRTTVVISDCEEVYENKNCGMKKDIPQQQVEQE